MAADETATYLHRYIQCIAIRVGLIPASLWFVFKKHPKLLNQTFHLSDLKKKLRWVEIYHSKRENYKFLIRKMDKSIDSLQNDCNLSSIFSENSGKAICIFV